MRKTKAQLEAENQVLWTELEFLRLIADGANLKINGVPWREMFQRFCNTLHGRTEEDG